MLNERLGDIFVCNGWQHHHGEHRNEDGFRLAVIIFVLAKPQHPSLATRSQS